VWGLLSCVFWVCLDVLFGFFVLGCGWGLDFVCLVGVCVGCCLGFVGNRGLVVGVFCVFVVGSLWF